MTATTDAPGVFLLGLGAQKAGTSWLHTQLNRRRDADFGFLKEYHIHDALTLPAAGFSGRSRRSLLKPRTWRRQRFLDRPERYYAYFAGLLRRPGIQLTGDITPSYCGLSASTLLTIHAGFINQGIPVKPLFLMRDPIERIVSSLRMQRRKQGLQDSAGEIEALRDLCRERPERINLRSDYGHTLTALQDSAGEIQTLQDLCRERPERITLRSDYGHTLQSLQQTFGLKHCFIATYEQLFHRDCWTDLCRFLGVPYREPQWDQQVNVSRNDTELPEELLHELGRWQAPTLAAVQQLCPELDLHQLWPTASRWCREN